MAGSDARKQLLNLINDFASEKSHGERRVVSLRKRIDELGSELEVANAELEEAKRAKEYTEQEIKGYEVELAMNEAAIQTLELRISHTQEEISAVGSEVEALKNKQAASRRFQESIAGHIHEEEYSGSAEEEDPKLGKEEVTEGDLRELEDMLAGVVSQTTKAEEEHEAEQNTQKQVQQALSACRREVFLMEETLKATKEVRDLTRYPFQEYIGYRNCSMLKHNHKNSWLLEFFIVLKTAIIECNRNPHRLFVQASWTAFFLSECLF
ncbi:MAR-binding filament-like protein 1 [Malus sylvestris]|uniref:MAR-binding filament-like protein 1 n=1 Tax=Malus sylvestris TaxID=3752 RepID=UPI0021AC27F4|nr:MAR-binding filament-like protein 1 [Malus sylvestris]